LKLRRTPIERAAIAGAAIAAAAAAVPAACSERSHTSASRTISRSPSVESVSSPLTGGQEVTVCGGQNVDSVETTNFSVMNCLNWSHDDTHCDVVLIDTVQLRSLKTQQTDRTAVVSFTYCKFS